MFVDVCSPERCIAIRDVTRDHRRPRNQWFLPSINESCTQYSFYSCQELAMLLFSIFCHAMVSQFSGKVRAVLSV